MGEQTCSNHKTDMKLIAISALAASAAAASLHTEWNQFKARFGKSYTATEEARRMAIFKENLAFVERHNADHRAGRETYTVAMNKFADLSNAEFRQQYLAQDCTSWTGAAEQELVDCGGKDNTALGPYYDMACNGGWIDNALYYIILNGGISNYDNYAYVSGNTRRAGTCNPQGPSAGTINDCGATKKNSESDLQAAVAEQGVIGIAIDAGGIGFQLYSGGVYTSNTCSSSRLNHAVTCVGYGAENGTPYWTVKNSWGTGWGDNGYILMHRNYNNMCGVAATPAYAIAP